MAIFRKIDVNFWTDVKVCDDMAPFERYFYIYLLTNSYTKQCGCYSISLKQMQFDTELSKDEINNIIAKFSDNLKLIKYSIETKEMYILNWAKYNWTKSPKVVACIKQELMQIKNIEFKNDLIEKLKNYTEDCSDLFRMANRSEISKKLAEEIMERDDYTCQICGSTEDLTIDHILPRTLGGKNIKENLRVLCRSCNSKRPLDGEKLFIELKQQGYNIEELLKINSDTVSKKNDTISKNIDTETQEEKEKEKEEEKEEEKETSYHFYNEVLNLYNSICTKLSKVEKLSKKRKEHLKARMKELNLDDFKTIFEKVNSSDFLTGKNDRNWKADFDWIIKNDDNYTKVLEGKYNQKEQDKSKLFEILRRNQDEQK